MAPLWQQTASESARLVRAGEVSARELVEASLARIAEEDADLRSFITVSGDRALAEADAADAALAAGRPPRPLEGLPFAVKDLTDTAGVRTTRGSLLHADHIPAADELCVARLRAAGAILVGKTNTPEFGAGPRCTNRLFGPTANPYDLAMTSGGSSGGSAAAVAAGLVPLAHGTDFGGSVRTPASFCGVVGLRPTPGVIPSASRPLAWNNLVTHGVIARTVDDAALMLSAMTGHDPRDPLSRPGPSVLDLREACKPAALRIGFSADLGVAPVSQEVRTAFADAVAAIAGRCRHVEAAHPDCTGAREAFATLRAGISHQQNAALVARHRDQLTAPFIWNVERGAGLTGDEFVAAEEARTRTFARFIRFFDDYDLLLLPSAAVAPFPNTQEEVLEIDGRPLASVIDYLAITYLISLVGMPCLSIPCGVFPSGLPVGLQIVALPYGEARLIAFARFIEAELGFRHRWPAATQSPAIAPAVGQRMSVE